MAKIFMTVLDFDSLCRMAVSSFARSVLCGIVAWSLAASVMVVGFNIQDLFVPVDMHDFGNSDPLERQVWELVMSPIEDTSLVTCTKRVYGESTSAWVDAPPIYIKAGVY